MTIHVPAARWRGAALLAGLLAAVPLLVGTPADASVVPTVPLGPPPPTPCWRRRP